MRTALTNENSNKDQTFKNNKDQQEAEDQDGIRS